MSRSRRKRTASSRESLPSPRSPSSTFSAALRARPGLLEFYDRRAVEVDQLAYRGMKKLRRRRRVDRKSFAEARKLLWQGSRSLMDLMGGTFDLSIDGDLFKAELTLPAAGPAL